MSKQNQKQYVITITVLPTRPDSWTDPTAWPSTGLYQIANEDYCLYGVGQGGVEYINTTVPLLVGVPYRGEGVSESLFLKALAAAARAEVLK